MENTKKSSFTGRIGFVLAAAGSAVGLGNLWRFPYLAAKCGGGLFLLIYIVLALTFGFALLTTEIALGRKTGLSTLGAYKSINKHFGFLGYLGTIVPIIIMPYYCVIGGWVTKYMATFVMGDGALAAADTYFGSFIGDVTSPLLWFFVFLMITSVIVMFGVEKGIEKVSKVMMPILIFLTIGLSIYILTLDGAMAGLKYYIIPSFKGITFGKFVEIVLAAMGQLFYSMSIAMGIMITYGSYAKKDVSLVKSVNHIELFDTGIAFLAGLMIIPAVAYANGGNLENMNAGPGLMFASLPKIFDKMPLGGFIGTAFFILVFFAALTSSISLMEAIAAVFIEKLKVSRKVACLIVIGICLLLGIPSSLGNGVWSGYTIIGMDFLTFFDFISNNVLMPIVAFATCVLIGWVTSPDIIIDEVMIGESKFGRKGLYKVMIKYIAPICLIGILVYFSLTGLGIISGI